MSGSNPTLQDEVAILQDELATLANDKKSIESRAAICKATVLGYERELEQLQVEKKEFQTKTDEEKTAYLAAYTANSAELESQHRVFEAKLNPSEETLDYLKSRTDLIRSRMEQLGQQSTQVAIPPPHPEGGSENLSILPIGPKAVTVAQKGPVFDVPLTEDFSKISTVRIHELTGVSKLSQIQALNFDDIVRFATWIGGPNGRGYDENPEFLDRFTFNKDNDPWKLYCGHHLGKFKIDKNGHKKKYIVMRLALYLDLEIDDEVNEEPNNAIKEGVHNNKRSIEPSTDKTRSKHSRLSK